MPEIDPSRVEWRKSSYSSQDGNCVEVAAVHPPALVAARDSKHPTGPALLIPREAWRCFIKSLIRYSVTQDTPAGCDVLAMMPAQPGGAELS